MKIRPLRILAAVGFLLVAFAAAQAQVTRTWVSGVGDDMNPCSRTAPCKTYSGAFTKTLKNGEISTLDPGGYGSITITKSLTINGGGGGQGYGSILASGLSAAITVNITDATDTAKTVRLNWLDINGAPSSGGSLAARGVRVLSALAVHVENSFIDQVSGDGIEVNVATAIVTELHVRNTVIRNCGSDGVSLANTINGGLVLATIEYSQLSNNATGLNASSRSRVSLANSAVTACTTNGIVSGGTADVEVNIDRCRLLYNPSAVLVNLGTARVSNSVISGNTNGLNRVGGTLKRWNNNMIDGNTNDTVGTITPINEG